MAQQLREGLAQSKYCEITQLTQANGVFVKFPKKMVAALKEVAFFYVWNEHSFECRLMATWDTQPEEVTRFIDSVDQIGRTVIG